MAVQSPDRTSPSFLDRRESPLLHFVKCHGPCNDFIMVDNMDSSEPRVSPEQAVKLCDRNFGVGCVDGVVFVMPGVNGTGYAMRIFNSDGSEPDMCGNGVWCFARFVAELENLLGKQRFTIHTGPSLIVPEIQEDRKVEGIQIHANEGGVTQMRGGIYWVILPAGYLGPSFWGMTLILAWTNLLTARIAAGCFLLALLVVLFVAKNTLRGLCIGVVWLLQEMTSVKILQYVILFIGVMNSLFSVYDIYDDLISRRINSSDAETFAEVCPCPCNGAAWGVIWGMISFISLLPFTLDW